MVDVARRSLAPLAMLAVGALPVAAQGTAKLTVRPREAATATRTAKAGEFELDTVPGYLVHVPTQCAGAQRCPLLVFLPGGNQDASFAMKWQRIMADKYGIVILSGSNGMITTSNLDAALKQTLRKVAIDPEKIALLGRCAGGAPSVRWGGNNLNVFSRVLPISGGGGLPVGGVDAPNGTGEFFLDAGLWESSGNFRAARELRQAGHPAKLVVALRAHGENVEDYDFVGRWLQESWATPKPAQRSAPRVLSGATPLLTTAIVDKMTAFWTRFMKEPDSIFMTARRAHQRETLVPVGEDRPSIVMMDMPALAAKSPSVAAALKAAGITAEQHDAYRVALLSALLAGSVGSVGGTDTALAKNVTFVKEHPDELDALAKAGVDQVELMQGYGMDGLDPEQDPEAISKKYALGIWRTP